MNGYQKGKISFVLGLIASATSVHAGGLPTMLDSLGSFSSFRMAWSELRASASLQDILTDSERHSLTLAQDISTPEMRTSKFQHYFKGIEVVGSMALHHVYQAGTPGTEVTDAVARFDLDPVPTLSSETAVGVALSHLGDVQMESAPSLRIFPNDDGSARLVYWLTTLGEGFESGHDVIIDAHSGELVASISKQHTLDPTRSAEASVQVYSAKGRGIAVDLGSISNPTQFARENAHQCQVVNAKDGFPLFIHVLNCASVIRNGRVSSEADLSAKQAAANSSKILNYYRTRLGRNGIDGAGGEVVSVVHAGIRFGNAYWDSQRNIMAYGAGDGKVLRDFTVALDVAGHELTHGVTSRTAKLIYMGESGALNEAYSDFFGILAAGGKDWSLGRSLFVQGGKVVRSLANPSSIRYRTPDGRSGSYPAHLNQKLSTPGTCDRENDQCYVHINSTIPGHASFLVARAIGAQKAEKIFYTTLVHRLTARANFKTFSAQTTQTCKQLYDEQTCNSVKAAFSEVGL
jgi:bacillolysin